MGVSLTSKIERKVYDAIDEICNEFNLDTNCYPEVYWLYQGLSFDKLGISKNRYKDDFDYAKKSKTSMTSHLPWMIWIGSQHPIHIHEEAGHAINFKQSKISFSDKNKNDLMSTYALTEMIGYFSSKIADTKRTPIFKEFPDIIDEERSCLREVKKANLDPTNFYIYQQGYNLGEKLFNAYISHIVSKENIKNLFQTNLNGENVASTVFLRFKYDILNFEGRMPSKSVQKILQN